jgi:hypothetical protein
MGSVLSTPWHSLLYTSNMTINASSTLLCLLLLLPVWRAPLGPSPPQPRGAHRSSRRC